MSDFTKLLESEMIIPQGPLRKDWVCFFCCCDGTQGFFPDSGVLNQAATLQFDSKKGPAKVGVERLFS